MGDAAPVPQKKGDEKLRKAVGARIKQTRIARRIKQTDLAEAAGVKPHTMWRYEEGQTLPSSTKLDRIADALGVPQRWILRGGVTPPGLALDGEASSRRRVEEPSLVQEQQLAVLDELNASPRIRACWAMHRQGIGAFQRITRVYMSRFLEIAQLELSEGATLERAAEVAGEYAFNSAVDAFRDGTPSKAAATTRKRD